MNCESHLHRDEDPRQVSRRWFFKDCGVGLGAIALGQLLRDTAFGRPLESAANDPLAPKPPHFAPRAKNVIWLFMIGGASHLESFDPKPALNQYAGKSIADTPHKDVLASPFLDNERDFFENFPRPKRTILPVRRTSESTVTSEPPSSERTRLSIVLCTEPEPDFS